MTFELNKEGREVYRKRVQRLMRLMGIEALVPRPGTSKAAPGHKIYPYLLRGLKIVEPNHVWAADVTYIPLACGFLYLVAIIDWASRAVLAWRLSNTNDASFCAAALEEALLQFGKPRIFNTDQGSTFTAEAFACESRGGRRRDFDGRTRAANTRAGSPSPRARMDAPAASRTDIAAPEPLFHRTSYASGVFFALAMHLRALANLPLRRLDPPLGPTAQRLPPQKTRLLDHPLFRRVGFLQFALLAFDR